MTTIAAFIALGELLQLAGHVIIIWVLEEHVDLLWLMLVLIALIGYIQFLTGIAAKFAPKEHEADIALS